MANCHKLFTEFNSKIRLSDVKRNSLRQSRDSLRKKIRAYTNEKKSSYTIKFRGQGSFMMDTIIMPKDGKYDMDDGVYLVGEYDEMPSASTLHNWVYEAAKNHTANVQDLNTCVRVNYADDHHIDLPAYYKAKSTNDYGILFDQEDIPKLAHKSSGWIESDPYAFILWFREQCKLNGQLRRLVRYMKIWCDFNSSATKMPSGIIITILTTNNARFEQRDDLALFNTLRSIQDSIDDREGKFGIFQCFRPTPKTNEDLLSGYSEARKSHFLNKLDSIIKSAEQAINESNQKEACKKWQKHLGEKFPCHLALDEEDETAKSYSKPAIIRENAKSANN